MDEQLVKRERAALERLAQGDESARKELIECNVWVTHYAAKKYTSNQSQYDDLVSLANLGLVKAMNSFDPAKGVKPASYAMRCIKNEFFMYFRRSNRHVNEVSLEGGFSQNDAGKGMRLEDMIATDGEHIMRELLEREWSAEINAALAGLGQKERIVMELRYGLNGNREHTQVEIAQKLHRTQSYISKTVKKSLKKIKTTLEK